jgi:hypothetical protein
MLVTERRQTAWPHFPETVHSSLYFLNALRPNFEPEIDADILATGRPLVEPP